LERLERAVQDFNLTISYSIQRENPKTKKLKPFCHKIWICTHEWFIRSNSTS